MEFLLECIGFPPGRDWNWLADEATSRGEPVAWRGPQGRHWRLDLGSGLELRADCDEGEAAWTLLPHFEPPHRVRVLVESLRTPVDSPYDAVLVGWTRPPESEETAAAAGTDRRTERLSALLVDARRLPRHVPAGHVLALALAGFSVQVEAIRKEAPSPPRVRPLLGPDEPGGCIELAATIRRLRRLENPLTQNEVHAIEVDGPGGRPLELFVSPWQLFEDGLPAPHVGDRIEGSFLLSGRVTGGLPSVRRKVGAAFG